MITQDKLDKIFAILRVVHTSHWKPPKVQDVEKEIARTGAFVFRVGSEPWVADVKITSAGATYEVNSELPAQMKLKAEEMKKKFLAMTAAL